jgi:pimeloyl-ACP methyl ester carboxylesterase
MIPGLFATIVLLGLAGHAGAQDFTRQVVTWRTGDVSLEGTLYLPRTPGPHAAAVFIHGSGSLTRSDRMYREHAERLARAGLAMLVYDKRGTGTSTGSWRTATLADLADDALGGVRALRDHPAIAGGRVGLLGASQGGWIALIAASRDPGIAFIVTLSGPTITPAEQGHYVVEAAMRGRMHSEDTIARAVGLDRQVAQVYRTGKGWDEARRALGAAGAEAWFKDAGVGIQTEDSWNWKWYRDLPMDFDPMPLLTSLSVPLFAAHGETDALVPAARSAADIRALATAGRDFTAEIFPGVGHVLQGPRGGASRSWQAPDAYWTSLTAWLRKRGLVP